MGEADTFSALRLSLRLPTRHPLKVAAMDVMASLLARHGFDYVAMGHELGVTDRSIRRLAEEYRADRGDDEPAEDSRIKMPRVGARPEHPPVRWCSCVSCLAARAA